MEGDEMRQRRERRSETGDGGFRIGDAIAVGSWQHDYVQVVNERAVPASFGGVARTEGFQEDSEWTLSVHPVHVADLPRLEYGDKMTLRFGDERPVTAYFVQQSAGQAGW